MHKHRKVLLVSESEDLKGLVEVETSKDAEVPLIALVIPGNGCQVPGMLQEMPGQNWLVLFFHYTVFFQKASMCGLAAPKAAAVSIDSEAFPGLEGCFPVPR